MLNYLCGGQPLYITRLLDCEHRHTNSNFLKEESAAHLINELVTPEVPYATWREFVDLVYKIQDEYCSCVVTAFDVAQQEMRVSVVLGQVYLFNAAVFPIELPHLQIHGPRIIARLTKNNGISWCEMVAHLGLTPLRRARMGRGWERKGGGGGLKGGGRERERERGRERSLLTVKWMTEGR